MNPVNIWDSAQASIKQEVGDSSYETWFSCLRVREKNPSELIVEAPDEFFRNWIVDNYQNTILNSLNNCSKKQIRIDFKVNPKILKKDTRSKLTTFEKGFEKTNNFSSSLNPRFTFDNFVTGSSNRFAYAASLAVAENPSKAYNPLFIYGKVGLGKTHMMQAIAHKIGELNPQTKFCYISSELFTNELIDAIRNRSTQSFRKKYRNADVLLIDDIHFIAGKESTQEEFFNTFNALHNSRKQIVISSDRPPKEIANLEERLSSRFAWGLVVDIQPPDFETREAILRKKTEREPVKIPDDVICFIAQEIKTNIRELEGALVRVAAYSLLEEKPVSLDMAKLVLKDMVKETVKSITVDMVQRVVADYFNLSISDLKTSRRNKNIVFPRQVAMYLSRRLTELSLPEIGNAFGGKDHTTVLHSCKKVEAEVFLNNNLKNTINQLTAVLQS